MTSISTVNNSAYYQLSGQSPGTGGTSPSDPTDALLQALNSAISPTSSSSDSSAYLLDLSPQAQQYLNGTGTAANTGVLSSASTSFTLTAQQQQAISAILAKYKDAPYTQDTFDQIQNDLNAAGLSPTQLALEDQNKNFNPTQLLIDDLSGDVSDANALASTSSDNEQTKSSNYMQQVISEWKNMSSQDQAGTVTPAGATTGA